MPKPRTREEICCRWFAWRVFQVEGGIFYADGRLNEINAGRHSLGTRSREEARQLIAALDEAMAVKHGLLAPAAVRPGSGTLLELASGVRHYLNDRGKLQALGGVKPGTLKRYRAVFDKFVVFAKNRHVQHWQHVTTQIVEAYGSHLDSQGYEFRSLYLELTCVAQIVKHLINRGLLSEQNRLNLQLAKPSEQSDRHCYSETEVRAMVSWCRARSELQWLGQLIMTLALTGMRIGEAVQLTWEDVSLTDGIIDVRDDSRGARKRSNTAKTTKTGKSRRIPMHSDLRGVLAELQAGCNGRRSVFVGPRGGSLKPDTVRNILRRDVIHPVAAQLYPGQQHAPILQGCVHSSRHHFCTAAYRAGLSERDILDLMGHASSAITRRYRHVQAEDHRIVIAKMNTLITLPATESAVSDQINKETAES